MFFYCIYIYIYTCFLTWGVTPGTVRGFSPESYVHDKSVSLGYPLYGNVGYHYSIICTYIHFIFITLYLHNDVIFSHIFIYRLYLLFILHVDKPLHTCI